MNHYQIVAQLIVNEIIDGDLLGTAPSKHTLMSLYFGSRPVTNTNWEQRIGSKHHLWEMRQSIPVVVAAMQSMAKEYTHVWLTDDLNREIIVERVGKVLELINPVPLNTIDDIISRISDFGIEVHEYKLETQFYKERLAEIRALASAMQYNSGNRTLIEKNSAELKQIAGMKYEK